MKILSFFLLVFTFSNLTWATVEYGTLDVAGGSTSLVLNQGDVFEVTNFDRMFVANYTFNIIKFTAPDSTIRSIDYTAGSSASSQIFPKYVTIYGPTTVTLGGDIQWLMYKLTRAPNPQPAAASTEGN